MKDRKTKEKKHESTIGKIIYGFLLFLPLFAIGVTCGYAMFNKNAYKSTAMTEDTDYELISNQEKLLEGKFYQFYTNSDLILNQNQNFIKFDNFTNIGGFTQSEINQVMNTNQFQYYSNQNGKFLHFTLNNTSNHFYFQFANNEGVLSRNLIFNFEVSQDYTTNSYFNNISLLHFGQSNLLDNVFYYSIDKVQKSPLFNWAENSIIYTGMSSFTTSLSITTPFIPLLLTYWLIISVVYFLYDIVLIILVVLHRKIHYLEESI